jgi:hypothetical protein
MDERDELAAQLAEVQAEWDGIQSVLLAEFEVQLEKGMKRIESEYANKLDTALAQLADAESYKPCAPCLANAHDFCTGDCPSMCCALEVAESELAEKDAEIERLRAATLELQAEIDGRPMWLMKERFNVKWARELLSFKSLHDLKNIHAEIGGMIEVEDPLSPAEKIGDAEMDFEE